MTPRVQVWTAGVAEAEAAADTVLDVLDRAGPVGWLAPAPVDVLRLRGDLRVLVRYAVGNGVVHLADDRSAVAVWLDPPGSGPAVPDLRRLRRGDVGDLAYERRVASFQRGLWPLGDVPAPWQLLLTVGVDRVQRRRGCGRALVELQLARLDAGGVTAYAYAFDDATRGFLARLGFTVTGGAGLPSAGTCFLLHRPIGGARAGP